MELLGLIIVASIVWIYQKLCGPTASNAGRSVYKRQEGLTRQRRSSILRPVRKAGPVRIEKNEEIQRTLDLIESRSKSAFITGKAGTGKSTLLRYFRSNSKKSMAVLAPTGIAAINVGGQTIHSFFKFPPRFIDTSKIRPSRTSDLYKKLDTLIIDEVSMVRVDLMDGIDYALRINRSNLDEPFGGVQVVLFGDLFQLPPIVRDRELSDYFESHYGGPYFFNSRACQSAKLPCIELTKVYRQTDPVFINFLNKIRDGYIDSEDIAFLNNRLKPLRTLSERSSFITLTPTNQAAFEINWDFLNGLPGKERAYEATVSGRFDKSAFPTDQTLRLKVGARVMLLRNDVEKKWVNGTLAEIAELKDNAVFITVNGSKYELRPETWENPEHVYDRHEDRIIEHVVGTFQQFPIRLAWAITIHKSQGQTFDNVYIDFGSGTFAHGQAYVALSRCRTLEGLALARTLRPADVIFDDKVLKYRRAFTSASLQESF